jgi:peptidoglycan/xylan/chitin deacetylase (PgdA/CDA1 family)
MNPFFIKYPSILSKLYPNRITRLKEEKSIYLTFDDGPVPEITPWVLAELKKYDAKATFFCIGENVKKHSKIYTQLIEEGHSIGNHSFNHLNGWKTKTDVYVDNVLRAEETLLRNRKERREKREERQGSRKKGHETLNIITPNHEPRTLNLEPETLNLKLFRPPYGKIKNSQAAELVKMNYKIVMWDVLSGDFDTRISEENCLKNVVKNASAGSTIVFHDSQKAFKNLSYTLPKVLEYYTEKEFNFKAL